MCNSYHLFEDIHGLFTTIVAIAAAGPHRWWAQGASVRDLMRSLASVGLRFVSSELKAFWIAGERVVVGERAARYRCVEDECETLHVQCCAAATI